MAPLAARWGLALPIVVPSGSTLFFEMWSPLLLDGKHDNSPVANPAPETPIASTPYLVGILHQHGLEVRSGIDLGHVRVRLHQVDEEYGPHRRGSRVGSTKVGPLQIGQTDQT